jgi:hypothetical protein
MITNWPEWLKSGVDTKVGQVYLRLRDAGIKGMTQVDLYRWALDALYCTSVMERLRDLQKASRRAGLGDCIVRLREPGRRGTWRYWLREYAPEGER